MKSILTGILTAVLASGLSFSAAAVDLPDPLGLGQPDFFGRINIGALPRPPKLVFPDPVMIRPVAVPPAPVYLRVRPGHEKNWGKHCRKYKACGRPVYFVQDDWYRDEYAPEYRRKHGKHHGDKHYRGKDRGDKHGSKHRGHGKGKD